MILLYVAYVYIDNSFSGDLIVDSVVQKVNSRLKFL